MLNTDNTSGEGNPMESNATAETGLLTTALGAGQADGTLKSNVDKPRKRRFKKLTGAQLAGLPGAIQTAERAPEPDVVYYVCFSTPLTGPVGTVTEAAQVHDFVYQLGMHGTNTGVGFVASVSFAVGSAEIVLKLHEAGEQADRAAPVVDAFTRLGGFLNSSSILTEDRSGRKASWRAKINGTTIADGRY